MRVLLRDPEFGWTPYLWLVYLGFPFMSLILGRGSGLQWAVTLAAIGVFLPLYFRSFWLSGPRGIGNAAAIAALGFVGVVFNPGASIFFVFAAGAIGATGPPAVGARWLAGLVALIGLQAWLIDLHPWSWGTGIVFSLVVGAVNIHFYEVSRKNARLRLAHEEVERLAKIAERERIARDLHDLLGHTLSVVVVKSELAAKIAARDPERAVKEIREVEQIARQALGEVRRAVAGYRAAGAGGIEEELDHARQALQSARVALQVEQADVQARQRLGPRREGVLALALREAVTNVVRHASATTCRIRLGVEAGTARLEVSDDGRGGTGSEGAGLAGMRERVEALGGRVVRDGRQGTRIEVTLPLAPEGSA